MKKRRGGTPRSTEYPKQGKPNSIDSNTSIKNSTCKPLNSNFSRSWNALDVTKQLSRYFELGLIPIPLTGKRALVKWKTHWNPKKIEDLRRFIKPGINWGVRTGANLTVIDFDTQEAFIDFVTANISLLPGKTPIIRTGRGYHVWIKPMKPVGNAHYDGIDIKGEGGYVCCPPSIHTSGKPYTFIRNVEDSIPEVDLESLVFPHDKPLPSPKENDNPIENYQASSTDFDDEPYFAREGQRHIVLVRYLGYLISQEWQKEDLMNQALSWNQFCRPPLPHDEVTSTVEDLWKRYFKKCPNKNTQVFYSVLVETESSSGEEKTNTPIEPETPKHIPHSSRRSTYSDPDDNKDPWELEFTIDPRKVCGKKRRIVRKGRQYASVVFFCGRWDCPDCASFFRRRWINHLTNVTKDQDTFTFECDHSNWGNVRKAINRLHADYACIRNGQKMIIITNKPLKKSEPIPKESIGEFLTQSIPEKALACPISTSRGWQRSKNNKNNTEFKHVKDSWLPLSEQREIVEAINGKMIDHFRWESPDNVDPDDWQQDLISLLENREWELWELRMSNPDQFETIIEEGWAKDSEEDSYRWPNTRQRVAV